MTEDPGDAAPAEPLALSEALASAEVLRGPQRETSPPLGRPGPRGVGVAMLLSASALAAALLGARASFLMSNASGDREASVRLEVKRSAAALNDIEFVYVSEVPPAFAVAEARIRAQAYRSFAAINTGTVRDALLVEAGTQDKLAASEAKASDLASNQRYEVGNGYNVDRRLADVRAEHLDLVRIDPDLSRARADREGRHAVLDVAAAVPVAIAFLFGAMAQGYPRRRGAFLLAGTMVLVSAVLLAVLIETGAI